MQDILRSLFRSREEAVLLQFPTRILDIFLIPYSTFCMSFYEGSVLYAFSTVTSCIFQQRNVVERDAIPFILWDTIFWGKQG